MAEQVKKHYFLQLLIAVILVGGGYMLFRHSRAEKVHTYIAYFKNIQGLQPASPVQMNGVRVGKISEILLEGDHLKISMAVDKNLTLMQGTTASLANGGISGEKVIWLVQGKSGQALPENAELVSLMDTSALPMSVRIKPMIESAKLILNSADVGLTGFTYLINGGLATQSMDALIKAEQQASKFSGLAVGFNKKADTISKAIHAANKSTTEMAANVAETDKSIKDLDKKTTKAAAVSISDNMHKLRNNLSALGKTIHTFGSADSGLGKALESKEQYTKTTRSLQNTNTNMKALVENPHGVTVFGGKK